MQLASNFVPYNFKQIEIKPFTGPQLTLLSKAFIADDVRYMIEAVSKVINVDVNVITIPDFYHILLYIRYISMPKSKLKAHWQCNGIMYREVTSKILYNNAQLQAIKKAFELDNTQPDPSKIMVEEEICGEINLRDIELDEFNIIYLDELTVLDPKFDFPRCSLLPELIENLIDPENCLLALAAQWLQQGTSLSEKLEYLKQQPDLSLYDEASTLQSTLVYGVVQQVEKACVKCGTSTINSFNIDAKMFFRL